MVMGLANGAGGAPPSINRQSAVRLPLQAATRGPTWAPRPWRAPPWEPCMATTRMATR